MKNKKDINRVIFNLNESMNNNIEGGTINLTGNINRYTIGAKNIFRAALEYFNADREHFNRRIEEVLTANYMFYEFPTPFDTLGYWVNFEKGRHYIYVDLGFRFSDLNDALKFAKLNNEYAIWDNQENKEINVNKYLYPYKVK